MQCELVKSIAPFYSNRMKTVMIVLRLARASIFFQKLVALGPSSNLPSGYTGPADMLRLPYKYFNYNIETWINQTFKTQILPDSSSGGNRKHSQSEVCLEIEL